MNNRSMDLYFNGMWMVSELVSEKSHISAISNKKCLNIMGVHDMYLPYMP
jgi:hypothetical protein